MRTDRPPRRAAAGRRAAALALLSIGCGLSGVEATLESERRAHEALVERREDAQEARSAAVRPEVRDALATLGLGAEELDRLRGSLWPGCALVYDPSEPAGCGGLADCQAFLLLRVDGSWRVASAALGRDLDAAATAIACPLGLTDPSSFVPLAAP